MRAEQETQSILSNGLNGAQGPISDGAAANMGADGAAKPKGMTLGPIIRVVQRNILMIVGVASVVTLAGAFSSMRSKPSYQGSFRILVEPITSQGRSTDPSAISRNAQSSSENSIDYPTLLQVLQSPDLLGKIAKQIQTRYPDVTADSLDRDIREKSLIVQRVGTTMLDSARLIDVSYRGKDQQKVKFILEEMSKGYLRYSLEDRRSRIGGGVEFIEDQLPSLQKRVNSLESELQSLKQRYRITNPESDGEALSEQLATIRAERLQTNRELAEQETLYARLQQQLNFSPDEAIAASALSENPRYQEMLAELKKVEAQIAVKSAQFTPESPVLKALLDQRKNLAQLLSAEAQNNLGAQSAAAVGNPTILKYQGSVRQGLISQLVTAGNTRQLLQVRNQALAGNEAALDQRLQQQPVIARQYNDLQQQLEISNKTLNQFLTQRETLRIEAAQKEVPWEVIAAPDLARDLRGNAMPTASNASRQVPMAFVAGLLLGAAAALIKEKIQNIFHGGEDIAASAKLPLLGSIPRQTGLLPAASLLMAGEDPFSKSFSTLFTNLRFLSSQMPRSLVMNSPEPGDGKTTVAVNLAMAAASMGQKVLLVDANLRSPQLHLSLNLPNTLKGLSDVLAEDISLDDAIHPSSLERNLSVLTAGQVAADSVRLLASSQMQKLMRHLHQTYDLVIYDTPHLTEYADANFVAALTDGILMTVGIRKTKRPGLRRVMAELSRFRIPVIGVIANDLGKSTPSPYNKPDWPNSRKKPAPQEQPVLESLNVLKPKQSTNL
jgi:polysaccharide biosynthesis transport protein